jgi:hypothetical protein
MPVARFVLLLIAGVLAAETACAQNPAVVFGGAVRVDRLDVREIEGVRLRLIGADTLRHVVRENVPARLQAGQTYRDVRVRFEYRVSVAALDSILRPLLRPGPMPRTPADTTRRNRP